MRRFCLFCALATLPVGFQGIASAQAMVENALGAGRAAVSSGPMQGLGKSFSGAFGNLEKTLKKSLNSTDFQPTAPVQTARTTITLRPAVHYEDAQQIETGTQYDELLRRFGPASLEITTSPVAKTLSYMSHSGPIQVEVRDGKVSSIAEASSLRR